MYCLGPLLTYATLSLVRLGSVLGLYTSAYTIPERLNTSQLVYI